MTLSVDWVNRLVLSTGSIPDIVAFKEALRGFEDSDAGLLYPPIIQYKRLDLGSGAYFHAVDFINSYQLKFPSAGSYYIIGNIGVTVVPVAGVFVDRTKAAAFASLAGTGGSGGATAAEIRTELAPELEMIGLIPALI